MPLLPLPSHEVAQRFLYCKKVAPHDRSALCESGSFFFGGNEISVGTGEYGGISFSLNHVKGGVEIDMPAACRALQ